MPPDPPGKRSAPAARVTDDELDALAAACRVLVAISAQSIAAVADVVDVTQFRSLVIVASRGSVSLGELAESAGINLSTASRMCDRMVGMGLLNRSDDPANRRQLVLTLTDEGERTVGRVMQMRRGALRSVLGRLPKARRVPLVEALEDFAAAAGEPTHQDLWALGWPT
jgi:DNA-binding MarR family transcriptional regulator